MRGALAKRTNKVESIARAAIGNERETRERVLALEEWALHVGKLFGRGFLGRIRWLFLGR